MVKEVFAYLHTHWDREWYKTFEEYRLRLLDIFSDIFIKFEKKEINSFYLDGQIIALQDYLQIYPEKLETIKKYIKNKNIFIGPFYDLADEFLVNGESLCRNLTIGIKEAQKYNAASSDFIGYLPDAFGHCAWMPMIFRLANIDKALLWRGVGEADQEFLWQSPDGSLIKTIFLKNGYYQDFFSQKNYKKNLNILLKNLETITNKNIPILLPIGADHLACTNNIKTKIKNFNRNNKDFKIKLSSINEYFQKTINNNNLKLIQGEFRNNLNNYILPSTASSRIYLKQMNMKLQWKLAKITEPFYAILTQENILHNKNQIFEYTWKLLIQNHAHDSICGCSLDAVHRDNINRYQKVEQICNNLIDNAIFKISDKISKNEIGILNLSSFDFDDVISFYSNKKLPFPIVNKKKMFPIEITQDIHKIPVQENYKYYFEYLIPAKIAGTNFNIIPIQTLQKNNKIFKINNNFLENEFLKISINNDGTLNIKNKITNKKFKNIFKIIDEADVGDSYTFSCIPNDKKILAEFKTSKIIEDNQLRKILRLQYTLNIPTHAKSKTQRSKKLIKHQFNADLILTTKAKRLDIKIEYENLSKDHILKLSFELPEAISNVINEDTFGMITRKFDPNYNYKNFLPAKEFTEINLNTGIMQRFIITQGLCILTKGLQEYEVDNKNLNITMLRSFGVIAKHRLITRAAAAGPPLPTPEGQCLGKQIAEFSLFPTDNILEAIKQADFYYKPIIAIDGKSTKTTINNINFLELPEHFYLYSIKLADDNQALIVKIFNLSNKSQKLIIPNKKEIFETNLLEEYIQKINLSNKEINFNANELKIFRIK